jgi:hypothetical protein
MMLVALFVDPTGIYPTLLGSDMCWDEQRDARSYRDNWPVVAHPPCNLWVNLAAVNYARTGKVLPAWYPGGSDGGCFAHAIDTVRRVGGVVEHPTYSQAWRYYGLTKPPASGGWLRCRTGGWICEVWQSAYGHRASKRTWLYYFGLRPPFDLNWTQIRGSHQISWMQPTRDIRGRTQRPVLVRAAASATPVRFAAELIRLALNSR